MLPNMYFYDGKVSRIDGGSVTMILCLHVLITRRILLIVDMSIIFSQYRCGRSPSKDSIHEVYNIYTVF
jgi:hypothetical protein